MSLFCKVIRSGFFPWTLSKKDMQDCFNNETETNINTIIDCYKFIGWKLKLDFNISKDDLKFGNIPISEDEKVNLIKKYLRLNSLIKLIIFQFLVPLIIIFLIFFISIGKIINNDVILTVYVIALIVAVIELLIKFINTYNPSSTNTTNEDFYKREDMPIQQPTLAYPPDATQPDMPIQTETSTYESIPDDKHYFDNNHNYIKILIKSCHWFLYAIGTYTLPPYYDLDK